MKCSTKIVEESSAVTLTTALISAQSTITSKAPGFGALSVLVGLDAVAVILLHRQ